jgi:hypothetical protein
MDQTFLLRTDGFQSRPNFRARAVLGLDEQATDVHAPEQIFTLSIFTDTQSTAESLPTVAHRL